MTTHGRKTNTWGFGYDDKASGPTKPKDYEYNERLHLEALERKRQRIQAGIEHNQRLADEAEARRVERDKQRVEASRSFEWGGQKYPINGKGPIKPIRKN